MRDRIRTLLPRLHLLPPLTRTVVAIGADALEDAVAAAGPDDDVVVIDESVTTLEQARAETGAANVFFLLGDAAVLPLPDSSVDVLFGSSGERDRVVR